MLNYKYKKRIVKKYKKQKGCLNCRETSPEKLTYHHTNNKYKGKNLSTLIYHVHSKKYLIKKLNKDGIVVCWPCHCFFYHDKLKYQSTK